MAGVKLTADSVPRLPYRATGRAKAGWCMHWHQKLAGFGLRVTEGGARSYVVRYRLRGSRAQKIRTLGAATVLKFGDAFNQAREVLRDAERGVDWFDQVKRKRAQTMGQVWTYYTSGRLADQKISDRTRGDAKLMWTTHCERRFGNAPLADITPEVARDWHKGVTKKAGGKQRRGGPYVANRAAQALRAAWNYGLKYGRIPAELRNPFAALDLNEEIARGVILEPHNFPAFTKAVEALTDPYARGYIWLLFYTGCRRTELLKVAWSDVEILPKRGNQPRHGSILLRDTKGGEPRRVALSVPAIELLEALPRIEGNPHVFCGAVGGTHLDPKDHWQAVRNASGLRELRLHDLRRTFGSWLGASGVSPKLIGTALGHRSDITSRVYVQLGEAANIKRELAAAHAALAEQFGKEKPRAQVVNIKARTQG
jgi:integrase